MKQIYLVDVSSLFFRAFYAIRSLSNSKGMPTNALYGFLTMTIKLLREKKPDAMVCCFDTKEPNFRESIYPEYKAHRDEMPADLVPQVPYIKKIVDVLGIPRVEAPGFEADDLIATLTRIARHHHYHVVIVSSDKDLAQLVGPHVEMYDTMKDLVLNADGVVEKWGVRPNQIVDYLSLVGDTSDNIPGVDGVGNVTAGKLLAQFDSLSALYDRLDEVKNPKLKEKLRAGQADAFLSKKLVELNFESPLSVPFDAMKLRPVDPAATRSLLQELEFNSLEKKLLGEDTTLLNESKVAGQKDTPDGTQISTGREVSMASPGGESDERDRGEGSVERAQLVMRTGPAVGTLNLVGGDRSALEIESPALPEFEVVDAQTLGAHLQKGAAVWAVMTEREFFLAMSHKAFRVHDETVKIGRVLDQKNLKWSGFDLKEIWKNLKLSSIPHAQMDLRLAAYILTSRNWTTLSELSKEFLKSELPDFPQGEDYLRVCIRLARLFESRIDSENCRRVFAEIDLPLVPVLLDMERRGVLLDAEVLHEQSHGLDKDLKHLEKEIFQISGETFNLSSPQQLGRVLFGKLKMPPSKKTKTGFSTDSDVLEGLSAEYPIAKLILEYRELSKLKSTYVDALPLLKSVETGRIHTSFNQTITSTGRLSSTNPNLQNIPIRTERGSAIRRAFVAPPDSVLVSADYSQIELRILAHVTEDPALVKAFLEDLDIHSATAAEVFNVPLGQVTAEQRRTAKAVNFGLAYGMSAFGLAENLGIARKEATEIVGRYFGRFSRVKDYMVDIVEKGAKQGFVETIFGRRRYLPELQSKNPMQRKAGERAAINAPMQGTSADIVKMAMVEVYRQEIKGLILQVHDELVFEVPVGEADGLKSEVKKIMESVASLRVPLKVNVSQGANWEEAH